MATYTVESPYGAAQWQAKFDLANVDGDIVECPATGGAVGWTAGATWNAPANWTLRGAGTSATGGGDQTVIQDNYDGTTSSILIQINAPSGPGRITGITVQSGTATVSKDNGTVVIYGATELRIDHCHFNVNIAGPSLPSPVNYKIVLLGPGVFGVMDSCVLDLRGGAAVYCINGRDNGTGQGQGNYEWTLPHGLGGADFFFFEDNIVNGIKDGAFYTSRLIDGWTAGRAVIRLNTFYQAGISDQHGTGHAGDDRGFRAHEAYGNSLTTSAEALANPQGPNFAAVHIASGTGLIWGNSWNQVCKNNILIDVTRRDNGTYSQSAPPAGWGYAGTNFNGTGSNWDGGTFAGTNTVYGAPCLDSPGRGAGDLLTGTFPNKINNRTGIIQWPEQALEPIYIWNNTGTNVAGWGGTDLAYNGNWTRTNIEVYAPASGVQTSPTSPFNGTTGCGWGTLANRPTTCTTGVTYFATDQGDWNESATNPYGVQQNGASGVLYVATATDTWTEYYVPYTYPHPLRNETGSVLNVTTMTVGTVNAPS
jgi:hypothetical protein